MMHHFLSRVRRGCLALVLALSPAVALGQTLSEDLNPTGDPIGGYVGYSDILTSGDYVVSDKAGLLSALGSATSGQVIYVDPSAVIDLSGEHLTIPAGVTLASNRGENGSEGALLTYNSVYPDNSTDWMFATGGPGVRITGLRLEGPFAGRGDGDYNAYGVALGIYSNTGYLEVDNCELYNWNKWVIELYIGKGDRIHHNHFHHTQREGYGYGVWVRDSGEGVAQAPEDIPLIEANIMDWHRHHVGSSTGKYGSWTARYNYVGSHAYQQKMDQHSSGWTTAVTNNLLMGAGNEDFGGMDFGPMESFVYTNNWTDHPDLDSAFPFHDKVRSYYIGWGIDLNANAFGIWTSEDIRFVAGETITVHSSVGNDGTYTVAADVMGTSPWVPVVEPIPSGSGKGWMDVTWRTETTGNVFGGTWRSDLPVAALSADVTSGSAPLAVTFDATGASDPTGKPIDAYLWEFDDATYQWTNTPTLQHTFNDTGTHTVWVYARNSYGLLSEPAEVAVSAYSGGSLLDGLVSFWEFEEDSGTRTDSHGTHDLTEVTAVGSATGRVGKALSLSATSQLVIPSVASAALQPGGLDLAVQFWINLQSSTGGLATVLEFGAASTTSKGYLVWINNGQSASFYVSDGTARPSMSGTGLDVGTWHHVAINFKRSGLSELYVDGSLVATTDLSALGYIDRANNDFFIGKGALNAVNGYLDQLGIWRRALTADEVAWLYNNGNGQSYAAMAAEGNSTTQVINLVQGWNALSFSVQPAVTDVDSLLAGILPNVVLMQNEVGQVYYPSFGIDDIGTWNTLEGYEINLTAPATLSVTGTPIDAAATSLSLEAGWNLVPYLPQTDLPIEQALASIAGQIVLVIDNAGQVYYPAFGINDIGTMKAGEAYSINVSQAVTLTYPGQ